MDRKGGFGSVRGMEYGVNGKEDGTKLLICCTAIICFNACSIRMFGMICVLYRCQKKKKNG